MWLLKHQQESCIKLVKKNGNNFHNPNLNFHNLWCRACIEFDDWQAVCTNLREIPMYCLQILTTLHFENSIFYIKHFLGTSSRLPTVSQDQNIVTSIMFFQAWFCSSMIAHKTMCLRKLIINQEQAVLTVYTKRLDSLMTWKKRKFSTR